MSYTIRYGVKHEALLNELGIKDLESARREFESNRDFIVENLVPYICGAGTAEQEDTAEDLITMLTAWAPGQTEQEYNHNYDEDSDEEEEASDECCNEYFIEGMWDFPVCNHVKEVGPENLGYTTGMFDDGVPFEAELYSYGKGDALMMELGIMMPDLGIEEKDYYGEQEDNAAAGGEGGALEPNIGFCYEVKAKNLGVFPIGMVYRGMEENLDIMKWYQEYIEETGIVEYTGKVRSCSLFYYTDINGNDLVEAHINLIENGRQRATTRLDFRDFPMQKNIGRQAQAAGLRIIK